MINIIPAIKDLRIKNFGPFKETKISFTKGVNILYGIKAKGKTTIINAIRHITQGEQLIYKPYYKTKKNEKTKIEVSFAFKRIQKQIHPIEFKYGRYSCQDIKNYLKSTISHPKLSDFNSLILRKIWPSLGQSEKILFQITEQIIRCDKKQGIILEDIYDYLPWHRKAELFEIVKAKSLQIIITTRKKDDYIKKYKIIDVEKLI